MCVGVINNSCMINLHDIVLSQICSAQPVSRKHFLHVHEADLNIHENWLKCMS